MSQNLNLKKPAPLIRSIPLNGGAFYTFQSAAEDMTMSFSEFNNDKKFRFSKFALLNIPNISNDSSTENLLKLRTNPSTYNLSTFLKTTDSNIHFIESFQNYCLNLETLIISDKDYDCSNTKTVSERVFFKWLKELGGIRFSESGRRITKSGDESTAATYIEDGGGYDYSRVVEYIGDVSYSGNQIGNNNTFTEVFINVPQNCGKAPKVLFKSEADDNYKVGGIFTNENSISTDSEYICGRNFNTIHPDGLDIRAQFDCDEPHNIPNDISNYALRVYKNIDNTKVFNSNILDASFNISPSWQLNGWWYDMANSVGNSYYLEPGEFTNPGNDILAIYDPTNQGTVNLSNLNLLATRFIRSRLDGITIDWDINHYNAHDWVDSKITSLHELGVQADSTDFDFNAVLLYYDIYTSKPNADGLSVSEVLDTNLFGVLFLDNVTNLPNGQGEIKRFFKQRANNSMDISGNEYGFKINFKFDVNTANTTVTHIPVIAENNTMAMGVFHDALVEMTKVSNQLSSSNIAMMNMMTMINEIRSLTSEYTPLVISTKFDDIYSRIEKIVKILAPRGEYDTFENAYSTLFSLVSDTRSILDNFMSKTLSGPVSVDLSTIIQGDGINFERSDKNLKISTKNQNFNFTNQSSFNTENIEHNTAANPNDTVDFYQYNLVSGNNYIQFDDTSLNSYTTRNNFSILIKDGGTKWKEGQKVRISFKTPLIFSPSSGKVLSIRTDFDGSVGNNYYKKLIASFTSEVLAKYGNTPVIEIYYAIIDNKDTFFVDIF